MQDGFVSAGRSGSAEARPPSYGLGLNDEAVDDCRFVGHTRNKESRSIRRRSMHFAGGAREARHVAVFDRLTTPSLVEQRASTWRATSPRRSSIEPHARRRNRQDPGMDRDAGPIIVLVEPQLGENIGAAARVHGQFRAGAPRARQAARRLAGTSGRRLRPPAPTAFSTTRRSTTTLAAAIADCTLASREPHCRVPRPGQARGSSGWARQFLAPHIGGARTSRLLSGASATGSRTTKVRSPTRIVTFPHQSAFACAHLAQGGRAPCLRMFKLASGGRAVPFAMPQKSRSRPAGAGGRLLRQSRAQPTRLTNIFRPWTSAPPCW